MREIKIKIHSNKKMTCLNGPLVCKKGENKIDTLIFDVDENLLQYNNFLILRSPGGITYIDIVLNDMKYSIGSFITNELGGWKIQFLSSTQEDIASEEEIDEEQTIMISDELSFNVIDSLASGELVLPPTSANLDLLAEELSNIYKTLSVLIADYPEIEDYVEVQEMLNEILYKLDHIKIDTSELKVEVDLTPVLNAIDETREDIANIEVEVDLSGTNGKIDELGNKVDKIPTHDYSSDIGQIKSDLSDLSGKVSNIPTNDYTSDLGQIQSDIKGLQSTLNNDLETDNANALKLNEIVALLTDANALVDETLEV